MLLFMEALSGGLRVFFIFTSFSRLPLGDSTTILSSSPVIVMVLSTCFFRERCGVYRVVAATGLLAGVILISKPPFIFAPEEGQSYDSLGYSLGFAVDTSVTYIVELALAWKGQSADAIGVSGAASAKASKGLGAKVRRTTSAPS